MRPTSAMRRERREVTPASRRGCECILSGLQRQPAGVQPAAFTCKPPMCNGKPAAFTRKPPVCNGKPAAFTRKPPVCNGKPAAFTCKPPVCNGKPAVCNDRPAVCNGKPAVCNGIQVVGCRFPVVAGTTEATSDRQLTTPPDRESRDA